MKRTKTRLALGSGVAALLWAGLAQAQEVDPAAALEPEAEAPLEPAPSPAPEPTLSDQIAAGQLLLEVRARYEGVDQTRTAMLREDGQAFTVRTRLGWESADFKGFKGLIEFEDVRQIGPEHFAVNVPGAATPPLNGADKARYPIINDPNVTELNRAHLTWTPNGALQITAGRQRILLDDQRFVGNVGWRQDEQTFDSVRADFALGRVKGTYAYVTHINRILGELRDWDSDSHLLNVTWSPSEALRLQGFVYALDFGNSAINSSVTKGGKASGKAWLGLYQVAYNATYAVQSEYRGNTAAFDLDYVAADVAGTFDIYTLKLAYESLEGDGVRGFTTPLATVHAFQGWSDAFVSPGGNKSFADGIDDKNISFNVKPRFRRTWLFNTDLLVRYHDFDGQRTGADLGSEWDVQLTAAITAKLSIALKYADFRREATVPVGTLAPPASRSKAWLTLEYKL
ncbi:MAG: alginate export family protein [Phenylobacterium sp.]|uniref:alginate export family protein n=1 Tax=Phenylobacterium sp. TaxID=1871053 RepID=UPI00271C965D|nr:alginate export family protein [Phenylobacterium sp.]MDO9247955.1 alginate export family protein [Phenylobacterium sp.]MDP3631742.1 alginate export family protein [Phenylobacterium sp.]